MCLSVIFGNLHESHLHDKLCSTDKSTALQNFQILSKLPQKMNLITIKKKGGGRGGKKRQLTDVRYLVLYITQTMSNTCILFESSYSSSLIL